MFFSLVHAFFLRLWFLLRAREYRCEKPPDAEFAISQLASGIVRKPLGKFPDEVAVNDLAIEGI